MRRLAPCELLFCWSMFLLCMSSLFFFSFHARASMKPVASSSAPRCRWRKHASWSTPRQGLGSKRDATTTSGAEELQRRQKLLHCDDAERGKRIGNLGHRLSTTGGGVLQQLQPPCDVV